MFDVSPIHQHPTTCRTSLGQQRPTTTSNAWINDVLLINTITSSWPLPHWQIQRYWEVTSWNDEKATSLWWEGNYFWYILNIEIWKRKNDSHLWDWEGLRGNLQNRNTLMLSWILQWSWRFRSCLVSISGPATDGRVPFKETAIFNRLPFNGLWWQLVNLLRAPTILQTTTQKSRSSKLPALFFAIRSTVAAQTEPLRQKGSFFRLLYCHDLIFMQLDASLWTRLASAWTT